MTYTDYTPREIIEFANDENLKMLIEEHYRDDEKAPEIYLELVNEDLTYYNKAIRSIKIKSELSNTPLTRYQQENIFEYEKTKNRLESIKEYLEEL